MLWLSEGRQWWLVGNIIYTISLLHCDGILLGVGGNYIPHLVFDYVITTHEFNPSNYFSKVIPKDKQYLRDKVRELHNQGLGYTKIHQYLTKNGYEIGKSRTTVHSMIKKMKNRDDFFTQPILDGIGNFRVEMLEV